MAADEGVEIGEGGGHTAHERLVARGRFSRIDPDDAEGEAAKPRHLGAHLRRVVLGPTVGDHHDHGAAGNATASVVVDETTDAFGQPGAPGPIVCAGGSAGERLVRVSKGQLPGQPSQPGREDECLRLRARDRTLEQREKNTGVRLHRPGHIAK